MIRVGVVGVGEMGQNHVRVYNEMENADLVGIADVNERKVKEIANQHKTKAFTNYKDVKKVLAKGPTKAMVVLKNNMQADLRVVKDEVYGAALQYFTGPRVFNIKLRKLAIKKGYKLSEYGLFDRKTGKLIAAETEEEIFKKLGVPYVHYKKRD